MADIYRSLSRLLPSPVRRRWRQLARFVASTMPTGLFGRSLIIIIAPMILLQTVMTFVFMERHWQSVTKRLSSAVVRDISAIVDVVQTYPQDTEYATVRRIASEQLGLQISFLKNQTLPPPAPKPFFSILDDALSRNITRQIKLPFWIDTVGNSDLLEIRIQLETDVLRVFVRRNQAAVSNTHIFLLWMVGASIVLLAIAILFLRNQIRPIQRLAEAVERFGKGLSLPDDFRPRGAAEVRRASVSFLEMRQRVERMLEQRTAMLAGVSHDLRTVLTRFRLQLALVPQSPETEALSGDVTDMQNMLQGYLDFAQGETSEDAADININDVLVRFETEASALGRGWTAKVNGNPILHVRPTGFVRLMSNLISNAFRYAENVEVRFSRRRKTVTIEVHDDGEGIAEGDRETVFKPFVRLDEARNQDETGTGLGLSIARDIVHTHGGRIELGDSPLGGLCVTIRMPA